MLRKHLTLMISLFVMKLFFLFITLFTKSLTKDLRVTRARLKKLCTLFKSMLFVLGLKMSIRELTAEELMKFVRLMPKLTFLQELTVQAFSQEDKLRFFLLQHSAQCQTHSFLTDLTSKQKRDISTITTSHHIQ